MFTHLRFGWIKNLTEIVRLNRTNTYSYHRRFDDLCWPPIDKIDEHQPNNGSDAVCANCTTAVQPRFIRISNQLPGSQKETFKFKLNAFYHDGVSKFKEFVLLVHEISAEKWLTATCQILHSRFYLQFHAVEINRWILLNSIFLSTNYWESLCNQSSWFTCEYSCIYQQSKFR